MINKYFNAIDQNHRSVGKTKSMLDLVMDIALDTEDQKTFTAALDMANDELDRLEMFFDTSDAELK